MCVCVCCPLREEDKKERKEKISPLFFATYLLSRLGKAEEENLAKKHNEVDDHHLLLQIHLKGYQEGRGTEKGREYSALYCTAL